MKEIVYVEIVSLIDKKGYILTSFLIGVSKIMGGVNNFRPIVYYHTYGNKGQKITWQLNVIVKS